LGQPPNELIYQRVSADSSEAIQGLVADCPPLTLHTPFTYWVILSRSSELCIGAFADGDLVGFVLTIPSLTGGAFVWQIGVSQKFRRQKIAHALLDRSWRAAKGVGLEAIEVTIDPRNKASTSMFKDFAEVNGLKLGATGDVEIRDASGSLIERENEYRLR
jgi:L-2,4-diaminobutyric acid acetyltransferase